MADKIFLNGIYPKEIDTQYGKMLVASIKVETFIEELKKHQNNGYVNIKILKKREPDKHGNTHYVELNNWKPKEETQDNSYSVENPEIQENDDLPF